MDGRIIAASLLALLAIPGPLTAQSVPTTAIVVHSSVAHAQVFIDGAPEGSKLDVPISVEPGSHELIVESADHAVYKQWIHVEEGQTLAVEVELLPLAPNAPLPQVETLPRPEGAGATETQSLVRSQESSEWYERWWVWAALGVLVVGGTVFAVAASSGDDFVPGGELGRSSTRDWMSP
jgi:hypothetical protein